MFNKEILISSIASSKRGLESAYKIADSAFHKEAIKKLIDAHKESIIRLLSK